MGWKVQDIKNEFVVEVYETHASIAVEMGDWTTFSQCITVLFAFYEAGILGNKLEFVSYSLLFYLSKNDYYAITLALMKLPLQDIKSRPVSFSLEIIKIVQTGLYSKFFLLYKKHPHSPTTLKLLDLIKHQIRKSYLELLQETKAEKIALKKLSTLLAFQDISECKQYLIETHQSQNQLTKQ
eukprot:TRINITY_DN3631_c0_g1_i10.p2 TRINITY_DN3631_c0_g1~~TRINITY_DN3631_c0_g1_i10.p2  ORF type:complete len:182 (+),score=54.10 TRINITY_DN3631_c0_g1_i10:1543-2088(+)